MLLQPVIENSIHHGFSRNIANPLLVVSISCNEKHLVVSVTDNGQGCDTDSINKGMGLTLVQKRISLINDKLNGMPVEMNLVSTNDGTITTFTFQNWL